MTTATEPARAPITCAQGLCLDAGGEDAPAVWNAVAYEGKWDGHAAGSFAFTPETFNQIVRNFRADPRYTRRAAAGLPPIAEASAEQIASGGYDVLQWDFHHACEVPAAQLATSGAPAQGWVLELKIGEHAGKCALLALTRWLEPARTYIKTERYKFCSVSVLLSASDPVTNAPVGAVLTSIAITNNPFLQGLPPLRASADRAAEAPSAADLTAWIAQATALLALSTPHVSAAIAAPSPEIIMENATGAPSGAKNATPAAGALLVAGPDLRQTLAKLIAKRLNCSADDVSDGHILAAAENSAALQTQIDELMAAIGAKTLAEALAKMGAAEELKMKLSEALAGKAAAEEALEGYEGDMVEEDVGMALASLGVTDEKNAGKVRKALLAERGKTAESITAFRKTYELDALRKAAREELSKAAQKVIADRSSGAPAHITASIATQRQTPPASPQGETFSATMGSDGRITLAAPRSQEAPPGAGGGLTLSALRSQYPGEPNDVARKVAFVRAEHARNNPGVKPLDNDTANERAHQLRLSA